MTDYYIFVTPKIKEPKITHAFVASFMFNLKLCCIGDYPPIITTRDHFNKINTEKSQLKCYISKQKGT